METLLCSDAIFLAGSWHEAQKGNMQQGTLLGRLVLLLKIRGVGVLRTMWQPERLPVVLCLGSKGKQDQWRNSTKPVMAARNFVTSSDKGSQRKGALNYCSTESNGPGLGTFKLVVMLLLLCVILSWLSSLQNCNDFSGGGAQSDSLLKTLWRLTYLYMLPWDNIWLHRCWPACSNKNWFRYNDFFSHKD